MTDRLVVIDGPFAGAEVSLGESTSIGRSDENDLVLNNPYVSRRHARLIREIDGYTIENLSTAQMPRPGAPLITRRMLRVGDRFVIGPITLRILESDAVPDAAGKDILLIQRTRSPAHTVFDRLPATPSLDAGDIGKRLSALIDVGLALQTEHEIDRLLERIAQALLGTLEIDRCGIFLRDEKDPVIVMSGGGRAEKSALPFSRTLLSRAIDNGEAFLTEDAGADSRLSTDSIIGAAIRSAMVAPMWGRDRIIGAVVVENSGRPAAFGGEDLRLLVALANSGGTAIENSFLLKKVKQEAEERAALARFLSPVVADEVRKHGVMDKLKGARRRITVLFTDIRGFTSLAESLEPEELLEGLDRALTLMSEAILAEEGTIDKFTGDGVLAFFGAPLPQDDHAARALRSALAIRDLCGALATRSGRPLRAGIGVATGEAIVGPIGSKLRLEYTAIGDVVNVASRLVGMAAAGQILASGETGRAAPGFETRTLGSSALKGRSESIEIVEILAP